MAGRKRILNDDILCEVSSSEENLQGANFSEKSIPEISPRSTKDQILSAYNEVVSRLEKKQLQNPVVERQREEERSLVSKSFQASQEGIISQVATLKISLTKQLDILSENLFGEFEKLSALKQAIAIEQKHLEELYDIKETAHTLSALLLLQKEEAESFQIKMNEAQTQFEKEMEDKKLLWAKKHADLDLLYTELKEKREKQHQREEEDYQYALDLARREESQTYILKKETQEKALEAKEQELAQKEVLIDSRLQEMEDLKNKVLRFPEDLALEKERITQEVTEKQQAQHKYVITLKEKETEGEKKLALQKIASLEAKVSEQESYIAQLTQKANEATQQVQAIACKALEASSQRLSPSSYGDKAQEFQHRQEKQAS